MQSHRLIAFSAALGSALALALACTPASAAGLDPDFRKLSVGLTAAEMPTDGIDAYGCGSNGGPPLAQLSGWSEFAKCAPDANGLHEVDIAFGTELKALADQMEDQFNSTPWFEKFSGTRVAGYEVVMSMLFDDSGVARAFRSVTDQRAPGRERAQAYLMPARVKGHYGFEDWSCTDRPPVEGEGPVGQVFINQLCSKTIGPKLVTVESHLFRKRGQTGFDDNGNPVAGQFESLTIWESWDKAFHDKLPQASKPK